MGEQIANERESLNNYFSQKRVLPELVSGELGAETLDKMLLGLAVMQKHLDSAAQAARNGDIQAIANFGAQAKLTKDDIYMVLMESYGGPQVFLGRSIRGVPALLRDYIMGKYDGGINRCELLLSTVIP